MALNVLAGMLSVLSRALYDRTDHIDSGLVCWTFKTPRYFGSIVPEGIPVKVLPREKNALDPGFELKYNTPSTGGASMVHEKSHVQNRTTHRARPWLSVEVQHPVNR